MDIQKFAAFSDGAVGGNPAGALIADRLPPARIHGGADHLLLALKH